MGSDIMLLEGDVMFDDVMASLRQKCRVKYHTTRKDQMKQIKGRQSKGNLFIAWSQDAILEQGCSSEPSQGLWRSENKNNLWPQR